MSLHTCRFQGPQKPSSCATFTLKSHWGRAATRKKSLASMHAGWLQSCPTLWPCRLGPTRLLCQGGGSPGKNTRAYWLSYPSRTLYCLMPWPPAPLSTWCCQKPCDPSSGIASTPGPHRANPRPPGQPREQAPVDDMHAEVEIKPQLKPRGSVAKEENPKPFHSCTRIRLNPRDQLSRLCFYGVYKRPLGAPTKENALYLIAVDIGGKNTQEQDQIRI